MNTSVNYRSKIEGALKREKDGEACVFGLFYWLLTSKRDNPGIMDVWISEEIDDVAVFINDLWLSGGRYEGEYEAYVLSWNRLQKKINRALSKASKDCENEGRTSGYVHDSAVLRRQRSLKVAKDALEHCRLVAGKDVCGHLYFWRSIETLSIDLADADRKLTQLIGEIKSIPEVIENNKNAQDSNT